MNTSDWRKSHHDLFGSENAPLDHDYRNRKQRKLKIKLQKLVLSEEYDRSVALKNKLEETSGFDK